MIVTIVVVIVIVIVIVTIVIMVMVVAMTMIILTRPLDLVLPRYLFLATAFEFRPALILRRVLTRPDEVHGPITGVILVTMVPPVARVSRGNMQINRLGNHARRPTLDDQRLRVNDRRRSTITQVDMSVHPRDDFAADRDIDTQVTGVRERTKSNTRQGHKDSTSPQIHHRAFSAARRRAESIEFASYGDSRTRTVTIRNNASM